MKTLFEHLPKKIHSEILKEIMEHYVDKQGLGGISKPDFDALLVYLFAKYSNKEFDAFYFGQVFRMKEGRIKSLYETGLNKYSGLSEGQAWEAILEKLSKTKFELESYDKGQIRFKFENPALYKFFQKRLRVLGYTAIYSSSSEIVTITIDSYGNLLEHLHEKSQKEFATSEMDKILPLIKKVAEALVDSLGKKTIEELRSGKRKNTKAGKAFAAVSNLASIGGFFAPIV